MRRHILILLLLFIGLSVATGLVAAVATVVNAPMASLKALDEQWCRAFQGQSESSYALENENESELYIIDSDGSNPRRLGTAGSDPRWSSDGQKLAFEWRAPGIPNPGIGVVNADGTQSSRLVPEGWGPAWSPAGATIAFRRRGQVVLMNAAGNEMRELGSAGNRWTWAPDGSAILAFSNISVTRAEVETGEVRKIASFKSVPGDPNSWSPDRRNIALMSRSAERSGPGHYQEFRLAILEPETGTTRTIAEGVGTMSRSPWSPDGRRIAYTSSDGRITIVNSDGTRREQFEQGREPVWSPDGKQLAFLVDHCDSEIYVMNADGTGRTRLTYSRTNDYAPAWSPDGTHIAFTVQRFSRPLT